MRTTISMMHSDSFKFFEPDTVAPEQFYANLRRNHFGDPERRLMAAILEDAVSCLSSNPHRRVGRQRKYFEEARVWINSKEEQDWIFSFSNVCETLGFDPDYLRGGLNRWSALAPEDGLPGLRLKKYRSSSRGRKLRFRSAL